MATQTAPPPVRTETLASVVRYEHAQYLVDQLSDRGFPVDRLSIVGRDLRLVEQVTGRRRYGRAALEGAGSGAVTGGLVGTFLALFSLWTAEASWIGIVVSWIVLGAIVGAVLGLIGQALRRGRRDFSSTSSLRVGTYDVRVDADAADAALRTLDDGSPSGR